ncbi:MAG TPA: hypothetical protein PLE97_05320 [Tenuifilaceae bacterium]|nr:hypothetical protein [Tenuifilaceae bacterium]
MKLTKDSWITFTIERLVEIPQAGYYYRLLHESGQKFLLPAQYYTHYNLVVGSTVSCRVDKINCMGKVFLEPKHPYYEVNMVYNFDFVAMNNSFVKGVAELVVRDIFNETYTLFLPAEVCSKISNMVPLRVLNIRKGRLQLQLAGATGSCKEFEENEIIDLTIETVVEINGEKFFFLSHSSGCFALLKVKYYLHYDFEVGKQVSCQYIGIKPDGTLRVEPPNPFYRVGDTYNFTVSSVGTESNSDGETASYATVFDIYGMKCGFVVPAGSKVQPDQVILCKVVGYKKGRPMLMIVQK